MKTLLALTAVATLSLAACHLKMGEEGIEGSLGENTDDDACSDVDDTDDDHAGVGGSGGEGGSEGGAQPALCSADDECAAGEICREDGSCAIPTCAEIDTELVCLERGDCETIYAGVDCSCGPDCSCQPGEAGCICESFEYFKCEDAPAP